ncbi:hypothetical protein CHUAL_002130 [Chamberlinius hualienensis]
MEYGCGILDVHRLIKRSANILFQSKEPRHSIQIISRRKIEKKESNVNVVNMDQRYNIEEHTRELNNQLRGMSNDINTLQPYSFNTPTGETEQLVGFKSPISPTENECLSIVQTDTLSINNVPNNMSTWVQSSQVVNDIQFQNQFNVNPSQLAQPSTLNIYCDDISMTTDENGQQITLEYQMHEQPLIDELVMTVNQVKAQLELTGQSGDPSNVDMWTAQPTETQAVDQTANQRSSYFLRSICRQHRDSTDPCILDEYFFEYWPDITAHYNVDFGFHVQQQRHSG